MIVKFARHVAKVEILRKKNELKKKSPVISIKEDISPAQDLFISKMKTNNRVDSAWTRERLIYFKAKNERSVHKINNLFQGAMDLNYNFEDITSHCFRR